MFIVLYRWKLRSGCETDFVAAWSRLSNFLQQKKGSLGSRLHSGSDGLWYSYAQWPSAEVRKQAFAQVPFEVETLEFLNAAVLEHFTEIILDSRADFLQ